MPLDLEEHPWGCGDDDEEPPVTIEPAATEAAVVPPQPPRPPLPALPIGMMRRIGVEINGVLLPYMTRDLVCEAMKLDKDLSIVASGLAPSMASLCFQGVRETERFFICYVASESYREL